MKKRKYPESEISLDKNAVLMPGGQRRMARIPQAYGKGTDTYNQGMQNNMSKCATRRPLKQVSYSTSRPHRVPLLSANGQLRL